MEATEFLETASRLEQGEAEADHRSAVSRAYYAVFHKVKEVGQGRADWNDGPGDHGRAESFVKNYRDREQARRYSRLRRARKKADDSLDITLTPREAEEHVRRAQAFFERE